MDTTTILKLENIFKYFYEPAKFQVLNGIDLEIKKGSFVSIVGKSGCGKSTLLYILSTLDTDYDGKLSIAGEVLTGKTPDYLAAFRNKHIGFIFQFHYLLPEFTALENVMIPALRLGILPKQEIEANAMGLLKQLDLGNFANRRAGNLSGGQQQRVAIARALINNPIIIIGDEPTGNLDSENSALIVDIFKDLSREKEQTIIIVTHDDEVAANTDTVIEMKDGSLTGKSAGKFIYK